MPPTTCRPNAPTSDYFHTKIYYDPAQTRSKAAARGAAEPVAAGRRREAAAPPKLLALDPGSMLRRRARHRVPRALAPAPHAACRSTQPRVRALRPVAGRAAARAERRRRSTSRCSTRPCSSAARTPTRCTATSRCASTSIRRASTRRCGSSSTDGGQRLLGHRGDRLERRAGAQRPKLPARPRRPRVRPLLHGLAPAHGRPAARTARRYWVVNTLARLALERDDARDRQGSQTANNR